MNKNIRKGNGTETTHLGTQDKMELLEKAKWSLMHIGVFSCRDFSPQKNPKTPEKILPTIIQLLESKSVGLWQAAAPMICSYWGFIFMFG